ncbi:extracellular solute-binding protein [Sneathia sanguinegens]|uniref:extracellular solute-binding protein n=1 Tax=Sneathia sanguinegens TaxID=40543 RepID=UPI00083213B7|nr:extracellular solute-binding protein [Sneathia sanguinegens]
MKKIFKILLGVLTIFTLFACGKQNSNVVNIYTWTYFIPEEIIENFEKETGIKVNISYYDNNDTLLTKLFTGSTQYDIISPSTDYVDILVKKGLLEKLDKNKLGKTFENLDTDRLKLYEFAKGYDEGLNYSIPYGYFATGINVNTKVLGKDFPHDLSIFLNEKYKGSMTMLDDGREVIGMVLQNLGYPSNSKDDKQLNEVKDLLIKYKKNLAKFDSTTFGKGLASGEFVVCHGYPDVFYETSEEEQKNFVYFLPKGAMMYIDSMSILKKAPNKDNAYKFLEYLYRPENYVKVAERFRQIPVIKGVEQKAKIKPIITAEEVVKNAKLPMSLDEEAKEKQDRIWNEVKLAK